MSSRFLNTSGTGTPVNQGVLKILEKMDFQRGQDTGIILAMVAGVRICRFSPHEKRKGLAEAEEKITKVNREVAGNSEGHMGGDFCSDSVPSQHHTGLAADCLLDAKDHLSLPGWAVSGSELLPWAGSLAAALTCT
ncbi:hypothetical protein BTVI_89170 [Pitangus sulphuratus]|nr:hypothetical protein BTVI_89170 [Pitangus sulphuratus]